MWPCWIWLPSVLAPILREERPGGFVQVQQLAHIHQKLKGEAVNRKKRTNSTSQLKQFSGGGQTSNRNNSLLLFYITAKKNEYIHYVKNTLYSILIQGERKKMGTNKQLLVDRFSYMNYELWKMLDMPTSC